MFFEKNSKMYIGIGQLESSNTELPSTPMRLKDQRRKKRLTDIPGFEEELPGFADPDNRGSESDPWSDPGCLVCGEGGSGGGGTTDGDGFGYPAWVDWVDPFGGEGGGDSGFPEFDPTGGGIGGGIIPFDEGQLDEEWQPRLPELRIPVIVRNSSGDENEQCSESLLRRITSVLTQIRDKHIKCLESLGSDSAVLIAELMKEYLAKIIKVKCVCESDRPTTPHYLAYYDAEYDEIVICESEVEDEKLNDGELLNALMHELVHAGYNSMGLNPSELDPYLIVLLCGSDESRYKLIRSYHDINNRCYWCELKRRGTRYQYDESGNLILLSLWMYINLGTGEFGFRDSSPMGKIDRALFPPDSFFDSAFGTNDDLCYLC